MTGGTNVPIRLGGEEVVVYRNRSVAGAPALIVIHEVWGLNDNIRGIADRFAAAGYDVAAPDLLGGTGIVERFTPAFHSRLHDPVARNAAQQELRAITAPLYQPDFADIALRRLRDLVTRLRDEDPDRPVGIVGYCFGGTYAVAAAQKDDRLAIAVPFYGRNDLTVEQWKKVRAPVVAFYGAEDAPLVESLDSVRARASDAGAEFAAVVYPGAGHAFANADNPIAYRPEVAADAWLRTLEALREHLGSAPETTPSAAAGLLAPRYGAGGQSASSERNRSIDGAGEWVTPTIALQLRHRSVRRFTDAVVTDEALELIIAAAQSASQSSNLQVWSVIAVRDEARKHRISKAIGGRPYVEDAAVFLAWIADFRRDAEVVAARGADLQTLSYLENTLVTFVDSGIAAQNALLAAESLGLGGVFVGSLRNAPEAVAEELGLPAQTFPVFGLAIGHPAPNEPAGVKPRLPRAAVLHHESYDTDAWKAPTAEYEGSIREYFAGYDRPEYSWSEILTQRISTVQGLHGRHTIRASLEHQGFGAE